GARLEAAGVADVVIYDETFGRVLTCTDPLGDIIHVDERMDDLYGYRRLGTTAVTAPISVLPVRFTVPSGPYGAFLEAFGLTLVDEPNDYFVRYAFERDGSVGLHYVYADELPIVPGPAAAHLTFSSAEPMPEIAERLRAAGFETTVTVESFGSMLSVVDPDGQEIQVHEPATP
ncbi:MAG TPA: VOC family protein, partial [Micromonosporaceae bacterium]